MYVYCVISYAHMECYSEWSRMGNDPFATLLFNVCSAVTVVLCFIPVCLVCLLLCKEEGSSPVSLQLLR